MKKLFIGLAVVVVIVIGAGVLLWFNLGSLVKAAVEEVGSDVTQVSVTLSEVDVKQLTDGSAALRGLTVGNPAGFKSDAAFKLGEISIMVEPATVTKDVIVVKEVVISKPQIMYEFGPQGSNIGRIQKNVQQRSGGSSEGESEPSGEGTPKIVIEDLYVRDGTIDVNVDLLQGKQVGTALPTIHLQDIGKQGGKNVGASPAEIAQTVIAAISQYATKAIGKLDVGAVKDALNKELAAGAADAGKALGQKGGDALKQGAGAAQEGLKKLLGN